MEENTVRSSFDQLPWTLLIPIFSFLLDEAPLPDCLTLVSKTFRQVTYAHPHLLFGFGVRVDPSFSFKANQALQIGKGDVRDLSGKRNVVIKEAAAFGGVFPLERMPIYHVTENCTWDVIKPIFERVLKKKGEKKKLVN
ncbi:hypothetical protein RFI_18295 [Reticulomyxa filosa]|uniref:F-box domain-containing protein n=1 Tax=Reticulomyxa filosa TaxID=46433 RepID=X6N0V7_RETFI|nr:hypothetical protein RFI_18295 [Reticulomyxa filosa]|eukprot:ETO18952.1 hypothetical protein RFI_18295 [Reticulomyxa filosa]